MRDVGLHPTGLARGGGAFQVTRRAEGDFNFASALLRRVADWSEAFAGVPIYLHDDDRQWVTRPHPAIVTWTGDRRQISDDILLVRTGGYVAGGTILHWRAGAEGRGALLTGDVAMVAMDHRSLNFMYSYPNYIPLNAKSVRGIARAVAPLAFDRIHGAWWGKNIEADAKAAFDTSVRRYLTAIGAESNEYKS